MSYALLLLAAMLFTKPTVSLEQSCDEARAVAVVQRSAKDGSYRVLEVVYDGTGAALKADAEVAIDLKGMTYDSGVKYILFFDHDKTKGYWAVSQMRTEDGKEPRDKVVNYLRKIGKLPKP